jgi:predicted ATPase
LVLDNFEQALEAGPDVVQLVQASPWLKVRVTSREALRVRGERQYLVPPLRVSVLAARPSVGELAHNPAVALLVERSLAAAADFALTPENAIEVAQVCINLDGLPLAIELAAPRVALFPPHRPRPALLAPGERRS